MKISIDIQPLLHEKTGIGQYIYHFLSHLQKIDHLNEYMLTYFTIKKRKPSLPVVSANFKLNRKGILPGRLLEKCWKTINRPWYDSLSGPADIFHFPNFIVQPVKKGKTVATVHDLSFRLFPQFTEPGNLVYLNKCIERTFERADHIIADSCSTKEQIIAEYKYPEEQITVVYLGIAEYLSSKVSAQDQERVRKKYSLPKEYLFYCGTIEPRKNLKTLFKAFSLLKKRHEFAHFKLVLTGMKGWRLEQIYGPMSQYGIRNDVIFTNYVPDEDLSALFSMATVFIFPSYYEGFGLPPLEAMACNVPVISSTAPSLPEVLGDGALYFDPDSPEELEDTIVKVLTDESFTEQLKRKGKKQAEKYTWEDTAKAVLSIYEKLI